MFKTYRIENTVTSDSELFVGILVASENQFTITHYVCLFGVHSNEYILKSSSFDSNLYTYTEI